MDCCERRHAPCCERRCVGEFVKKYRVYQTCCYDVVKVCCHCGCEVEHPVETCPRCGTAMMDDPPFGFGRFGMGRFGFGRFGFRRPFFGFRRPFFGFRRPFFGFRRPFFPGFFPGFVPFGEEEEEEEEF